MGEEKVNINIMVFGPEGSGKSTTAVHLINKLGGIGKGVAKRVEKEDAEMNNAMCKFETDKYHFTVTDAPGHPDFSNNIITGVRDADCVILFVDSSTSTGDFEVGTSRNGQTCEPALRLAHTLGVEQMICCCNKMDATTPNYSKERYDEIKKSTSSHLKMVGYDPVKIPFVPISGLNGDNLIERSPKLQWYIGPTLREALNQIQEPKRPIDKPLRLPIEDVYKIGGIGTVAVGRVETGILKPGMKVTFGPTGLTAKVKSIEIDHKPVQEALAGESVRFSLKKMDPNDLRSGYVASNSKDDPAKEAISFTSQIIITTSHHEGLVFEGYTTSIDLGSYCGAVKIEKFHRKIDPITGMEVEKEPKFLQNGDVVIVEMVPKKPMVVETCGEYPPLGRFIIRDKEQIVGVGVIKSVEKKEYPNNGANKGIKSAVMKRSKQFGAALVNGGKKFGTALVNVSLVVAFQLGTALANN